MTRKVIAVVTVMMIMTVGKGEGLDFCAFAYETSFVALTMFHRDLVLEDYPTDNLRDTVMRFWINRRLKLIHNYSLVGYILSPNPMIMADAAHNKTQVHDDAAEALIVKLILDPTVVGPAKNEAKAELIDTFLKEYNDLVNRRGPFAKDNIWIMAARPDCEAYRWHQKYSLFATVNKGFGQARVSCPLKNFRYRNSRTELETGEGGEVRAANEHRDGENKEASSDLCSVSAGSCSSKDQETVSSR